MVSKSFVYNNIRKQITSRQRRLNSLRNLLRRPEGSVKQADQMKRNITTVMDEIRILNDRMRHPDLQSRTF